MNNPNPEKRTDRKLADLYPRLSPEQLKEAEENLARYVEHTVRMYERIRVDSEAYARFKALTASMKEPTMNDQRSTQC